MRQDTFLNIFCPVLSHFYLQCFIFWKKWIRDIKNGICQLLKMARSRYIVILIKSQKGRGTSFQSPALSEKHVRNSTLVFDQISFWYYLGFERNKHKWWSIRKSIWSNVVWYEKHLYSESVFNTLFIEIKDKCWKNFLWAK